MRVLTTVLLASLACAHSTVSGKPRGNDDSVYTTGCYVVFNACLSHIDDSCSHPFCKMALEERCEENLKACRAHVSGKRGRSKVHKINVPMEDGSTYTIELGPLPLEPLPNIEGAAVKDSEEVVLDGDIEEETVTPVIAKLEAAKGAKDIVLRINTDGGDIDEMFRLIRVVESLPQLRCVVDGNAASAGFALLQACPRRQMTARSMLVAHEPRFPTLRSATRQAIRKRLAEIDAVTDMYVAQAVIKLKINEAEFRKRIYDRDWWLNATQALEFGAIDEVLPVPNAKGKK